MKNFDLPLKYANFKHIAILYLPQLESIKRMVQEHYDTPEYDDTLFVINTFFLADETLDMFNKHSITQHRRIYYNFEHTNDFVAHPSILENMYNTFGINELWSMEPNTALSANGLDVKCMPVRYTTLIHKSSLTLDKKFDLGFVGIIGSNDYSPRRNNFFHEYIVNKNIDFSIKIMNGYQIIDLADDLADCKFILDSHRNYRNNMQNQVRLFEHICMGHMVLSEKSDYNMFPGLVYEWNNIEELSEMIRNIKPQDFSGKYKELTYTDEAYEQYRKVFINEINNKN